jgi:hypothetical protein
MYAKVPPHLKEPLLKELKQLRFKSAVKYYPVLVLVFASIAALFAYVKGHAIFGLLEDYIPLSEPNLIVVGLIAIVVLTAGALAYFLWQECRECACLEYLYCSKCDAVDSNDSGCCPVCQAPLTNKEPFYFTKYKDEEKIIERWGLQPSREA